MRRMLWCLPVLTLSLLGCGSGIPGEIDGWRVEAGPPGNEFYQAPPPREEAPPPPPEVFEKVRAIAPEYTEVRRWELQRGNRYFVRAEKEPEEYDFLFSLDGDLIELTYQDDLKNVDEEPGKIVLKGTRKEVPVSEIPSGTRGLLARIFPDGEITETWAVETPYGTRHVSVVQQIAFFSRPDGQIQAAGAVSAGALIEVELKDLTPPTADEILAEAAAQLGPHRERFNVQKQIERLTPPTSEFRFVVIGDSRSNPEMWQAAVRHINQLDPKPRFVLNTGDIVVHGYTQEYVEYFLPAFQDFDIPFFVAIGNHDDGDDGKALQYRYLFGENSLNYFFDYGSWRFVMIDNSSSVFSQQETLDWLEGVLKEAQGTRNIVVSAHKPVADVEKWAYHSWDPESSSRFHQLVRDYGVNHVFFGHIHAYSTAHHEGVSYTITGGGGAGLHDRYGPQGNVHHYMICDASSDGGLQQQVVRFFRMEEAETSD